MDTRSRSRVRNPPVLGERCDRPVPLGEIDVGGSRPSTTGVPELDRVLAGGLLDGSVTLVFGAPGVGKSTLLLQVLMAVAALDRTVLLVSAEESAPQVRARADRLGELPAQLCSPPPPMSPEPSPR